MDRWTSHLVPRVFWINLRIPEKVAQNLRQANIGEVITSGGNSDFIDIHNKPKDDFPAFEWKKALEEIEQDGTEADDEGEDEEEEDWDEKLDRTCGGWDVEETKDPPTAPMFGWRVSEGKEDSSVQYKFTRDAPFRLIMNQDTILAMITLALQTKGVPLQDQVNVFQALGGREEDLVSVFSRMKI